MPNTQQSSSATDPILQTRDLTCTYPGYARPVHALRGVTLNIVRGSFTAVMGPSGSGKTTLLHCAAGLQSPTSGSVVLNGLDVSTFDQTQLAELRRRRLGFVFQSFNLLAALTAIENVELPLRLDGRRPNRDETLAMLARVGLADRGAHRPDQLSGGQQQRVAIARALVSAPSIVFADEPTGALDLHSAQQILTLMRELANAGQTIIMVTHDPVAAAYSDQVLFLADGAVIDRLATPTARDVAARMAVLVETAERPASEMGVR